MFWGLRGPTLERGVCEPQTRELSRGWLHGATAATCCAFVAVYEAEGLSQVLPLIHTTAASQSTNQSNSFTDHEQDQSRPRSRRASTPTHELLHSEQNHGNGEEDDSVNAELFCDKNKNNNRARSKAIRNLIRQLQPEPQHQQWHVFDCSKDLYTEALRQQLGGSFHADVWKEFDSDVVGNSTHRTESSRNDGVEAIFLDNNFDEKFGPPFTTEMVYSHVAANGTLHALVGVERPDCSPVWDLSQHIKGELRQLRLDGGEGPFTYCEFLTHYGTAEEADAAWHAGAVIRTDDADPSWSDEHSDTTHTASTHTASTCDVCDEPMSWKRDSAKPVATCNRTDSTCTASVCSQCTQAWVQAHVDTGSHSIKCPAASCTNMFTTHDAQAACKNKPELHHAFVSLMNRDYAAKTAEIYADLEAGRWARANTVKCPSCSQLVERSYGCDHMSCVCGAEFCYRCGGTYYNTNGVHWDRYHVCGLKRISRGVDSAYVKALRVATMHPGERYQRHLVKRIRTYGDILLW